MYQLEIWCISLIKVIKFQWYLRIIVEFLLGPIAMMNVLKDEKFSACTGLKMIVLWSTQRVAHSVTSGIHGQTLWRDIWCQVMTDDDLLPSREWGSCDQRVSDTASQPQPRCWRNRSQEPAKDQFNTAHHFWTARSNDKLTHPNFDLNGTQQCQNWNILTLIYYAPLPFQHGGQAVLQGPVRS